MTVLEVQHVTRKFGSLVAVKDVSMTVQQGELRAIIGPNGAGKTTFFNMISGLFAPTSGRIIFEGRDVTNMPPAGRVKNGMARTFQITEIFPELTVYDNIRIGAEVAAGHRLDMLPAQSRSVHETVMMLLKMGGLIDKRERLVGELSHGDQRATEIMMALSLRPRLLLLDEPTAGMGDIETHHITNLIRRLHKDERLTIILIEHDMHVVFNLAEKITVLAEGEKLAEGIPSEIAANDAVQRAYLGQAV
ncbi:MAG TPA: ABC transporter ATP-binding protein [Hyphomicrobiales bacterium]|nr:ABC transporter ATP-binding protein [Hyphomicrobiales bacterium]